MTNPYAPPDPDTRPAPEHEGRGDGADNARPPGRPERPERPERPKLTPEQLAPISRAVLLFGLLMLGAVLTAQIDLPWQVISPLLTIGAMVIGVRTLITVFRQRLGGVVVGLLIGGLALTGLLLLSSLGNLAMWDAQMERQQCLRSALTLSAQDRCERAYSDAVTERLGTGE